MTCQSCGAVLEGKQRKFCSLTCVGMVKRKTELKRGSIYKRILRFRKPACEQCGTMDKRLDIHHKDRDWKNNDPTNLQTLCISCHALLHHAAGEILPRSTPKLCKYCGHLSSYRTVCNACRMRIRKYGDPFHLPTRATALPKQ